VRALVQITNDVDVHGSSGRAVDSPCDPPTKFQPRDEGATRARIPGQATSPGQAHMRTIMTMPWLAGPLAPVVRTRTGSPNSSAQKVWAWSSAGRPQAGSLRKANSEFCEIESNQNSVPPASLDATPVPAATDTKPVQKRHESRQDEFRRANARPWGEIRHCCGC
jgi:hypothetical protein